MAGIGANLKTNKFSRNQLLFFGLLFGLIGGYLLWRVFASPIDLAAIQAEKMTLNQYAKVVVDKNASADRAVRFYKGGSAKGSIFLESGTSQINFTTRNVCGSQKLSYTLDGKEIGRTISVNSKSWKSYTVSATLATGSHQLEIRPLVSGSSQSCRGALYLDKTSFSGSVSSTSTSSGSTTSTSSSSGGWVCPPKTDPPMGAPCVRCPNPSQSWPCTVDGGGPGGNLPPTCPPGTHAQPLRTSPGKWICVDKDTYL